MKTTKNSPRKSVQIVKSYRKGDKVSQKIIRHVGIAANEEEEQKLVALAESIIRELKEKRQPSLPFPPSPLPREVALKSPHPVDLASVRNYGSVGEGIPEIASTIFFDLSLDHVLGRGSRGRGKNLTFLSLLIGRLLDPGSKRHTTRLLRQGKLAELSLSRVYRLLDTLLERVEVVKETIASHTRTLFPGPIGLLLFDITTLYFESFTEDDFRKRGESYDNKRQETQILLSLAVTENGLPLWYDVFPGNTFEGKTLASTLTSLKERFHPAEFMVVADRALFNQANLALAENLGYPFVI
ncbi:MAG: IS1634 family transposase, partial [Atribacterota bacterium]